MNEQPDLDPGLFEALCPVVQQHLGVQGEDAEYWAERLISHGLLNGFSYEVMDRPRDLKALRRINAALLELERACSEAAITFSTRARVDMTLLYGPFVREIHGDPAGAADYARSEGRDDLTAFERIIERNDVFREAVSATIKEVETSPFSKRTLSQLDAKAIGLVEGCRWVWWACKKVHAPARELNPATPFAKFLADAFEACGIESEPRSAYRAWNKEQQKVQRSS